MKAVLFHIAPKDEFRNWPADFPALQWAFAYSPAELKREIVDADVLILSNRAATPEAGEILRNEGKSLRWIHFLTAGFDRGIAMGLPEGVAVTHSPGLRSAMVAEHAMALLLGLTRAIPDVVVAQQNHLWLRAEISAKTWCLAGANACIVGLGHVGRELGLRLQSFGAKLIGVSRSTQPVPGFGAVFQREDLCTALEGADVVLVCTHATEDTKHLFGAKEFAAMKRGALFVNIARGSIVVENALIDAIQSGHLGGAALDVQATEPLPADSPLWNLPNVIISPHSAGSGPGTYPERRELFSENLKRLQNGEVLKFQYQ